MLDLAQSTRAVMTACEFFHPRNNFRLVIREVASSVNLFGRGMRGLWLVNFRPGLNDQSGPVHIRWPCFGRSMECGRYSVTLGLGQIHGIRGNGRLGSRHGWDQ